MPTLSPEGFKVYTQEDIKIAFPFFGEASTRVNQLQVKTKLDGSLENIAIGLWTITDGVCADHFAKFPAEIKGKETEVDTQLMPGHEGPEILGQTLGGLAAAKFPEHFINVLPSYRVVQDTAYSEPVFPGDQISACVELQAGYFDTKDRLRAIRGRGAIIFNDKRVSSSNNIIVAINPLEVGVLGLRRVKTHHQEDPWIPASFDDFERYFKAADKAIDDELQALTRYRVVIFSAQPSTDQSPVEPQNS